MALGGGCEVEGAASGGGGVVEGGLGRRRCGQRRQGDDGDGAVGGEGGVEGEGLSKILSPRSRGLSQTSSSTFC